MTQKEYKARQLIFDEWVKNIQRRINDWKSRLIPSFSSQLDFTPNSLKFVEHWLLEKFDSPQIARDSLNVTLLDEIGTYIGEVFIRNFSESQWRIAQNRASLRISDETPPLVDIPPLGGYDIHSKILPLLHFRTGNELIGLYELVERRIQLTQIESPMENKMVHIQERGYAYQYMVLLTDPKYTMQQLQTWLETYYQKKIAAQKASLELPLPSHLLLHLGNYRFHFIHKDEDWVKEESAEMADNYRGSAVSKDQIRQCASRIEFYGDEDPQMNYFNEQFSLLQQLKDEPGLLIFDYLNNQFIQEM